MRCRKCSQKNDSDARYCIRCGYFIPDNKVCPDCSTILNKRQKQCPSCGKTNTIYDPYEQTLAAKYQRYDRASFKILFPFGLAIMFLGLLVMVGLLFLVRIG